MRVSQKPLLIVLLGGRGNSMATALMGERVLRTLHYIPV